MIEGGGVTIEEPSLIRINDNGIYYISWEVFPAAGDTAFGLFFTPPGTGIATLIQGSNYGSVLNDVPYQGQVITRLTNGGFLSLNRIDDNNGAVLLRNEIAGGTPTESASIIIVRMR